MADPVGISLAPSDDALTAAPAWTRIDQDYSVRSWQIDRGRQNEMARTDTGTASFELVDRNGDFDPTNTGGTFYGIGPLTQAAIALQNPVTTDWTVLFRGFVSQILWVPYSTEQIANVTISLVDALAIFAAMEMKPGAFGDDFVDGNIVFYEDATLDAVQTRINQVLDQAGWDSGMRSIFTGNVKLQRSVYAPRSTVLQVMQDAADAEFPDIANLFIGGPARTGPPPRSPGDVVFHGRFARFDPTNVEYGLITWSVGDDTAAAGDPSNVVRISPPLQASLDDTTLYTSALATPQGIADGDISGQYVTDATAVTQKGLRTWSAENLLTLGGDSSRTGLQETKLFADYITDNYTTALVRVGQLTIKGRDPAGAYGAATWAMLGNVDISDRVLLTTTHGGGGGFADYFYVEGIHYTARPGGAYPIVELTLDVSPAGYYDASPF